MENKNTDSLIGKLPPQAIEVEVAVLGALIIDRDAFFTINNIIDDYSFYKYEHQKIFDVIKYLAVREKPVDSITVTQELRNRSLLDSVGGPVYISQLTSQIVSAAHIDYHARIVAEKYIRREMARVATEIIKKAYDDMIDEAELISFADKSIHEVITGIESTDGGTLNEDAVKEALHEIEIDCKNTKEGKANGIITGFRTLDDLIGGWKPGTLSIIASRPGIGKTSFGLHFTKIAAFNGKWVNFFSMEMKTTNLIKILLSCISGVERNKIRDGKLGSDDWPLVEMAAGKLGPRNIIWSDRAGININQIKSVIRRNRKAGRCDLVVIDYLQLIPGADKRVAERERQVAEISRTLKEIALNENIPIICLSQLNREAENGKPPKISQLRESGAIEQDADVIIFPWRPGYEGAVCKDEPIPENEIKLVIGKNRHGRRDEFNVYTNKEMTLYSESKPDDFTPHYHKGLIIDEPPY